MNFLRRIISTEDRLDLVIARIMLGIVILPHGTQKLFGWFGGGGFTNTMQYFTSSGIPAIAAFLVIMAESFGALALILGFVGRFMAFGIASVMTGAIFMVHLPHGFFMNWFGNQKGEGYEFHLLALGLAVAIMIGGSGGLSVDRFLKLNFFKDE